MTTQRSVLPNREHGPAGLVAVAIIAILLAVLLPAARAAADDTGVPPDVLSASSQQDFLNGAISGPFFTTTKGIRDIRSAWIPGPYRSLVGNVTMNNEAEEVGSVIEGRPDTFCADLGDPINPARQVPPELFDPDVVTHLLAASDGVSVLHFYTYVVTESVSTIDATFIATGPPAAAAALFAYEQSVGLTAINEGIFGDPAAYLTGVSAHLVGCNPPLGIQLVYTILVAAVVFNDTPPPL